MLVLLEVAAEDVPEPLLGWHGAAAEQDSPLPVLDERARARRRVRVADEAATVALDARRGMGEIEVRAHRGQ